MRTSKLAKASAVRGWLLFLAIGAPGCLTTSSIERLAKGSEQSRLSLRLEQRESEPALRWLAHRVRFAVEPFSSSESGVVWPLPESSGCASTSLVALDPAKRSRVLPLSARSWVLTSIGGPDLERAPPVSGCQVTLVFRPGEGGSGTLYAVGPQGWSALATIPPETPLLEPLLWVNLVVAPVMDPIATPLIAVLAIVHISGIDP